VPDEVVREHQGDGESDQSQEYPTHAASLRPAASGTRERVMPGCYCSLESAASQRFNQKKVAHKVTRYRQKAPGPTTRLPVDGIVQSAPIPRHRARHRDWCRRPDLVLHEDRGDMLDTRGVRLILNALQPRERLLTFARFLSALPAFWRHFGHALVRESCGLCGPTGREDYPTSTSTWVTNTSP